jgi:hypothetical protein
MRADAEREGKKNAYAYCTGLLFLSGLVEAKLPLAYLLTKRLADLVARRMTVEGYGTKFRLVDFLSVPIVASTFEQ